MQLDDLKAVWEKQGALLERSVAIQEQVLRASLARDVRWTLAPYHAWRILEFALAAAGVLAIGSVLGDHAGEVRYWVVGGSLLLFASLVAGLLLYLLVRGLGLDFDGPILALQRAIEQQKRREAFLFLWCLLGGVLLWLPAVLVLLEALTGFAALGRVDPAWLAANLTFGAVFALAGRVWSKRTLESEKLGPWTRRLVDALAGRSLALASGRLAEFARFSQEP